MITRVKSVILKQRMWNERSVMLFCGVVWDLIVMSFGSKVMARWFGWTEKRMDAVLLIL